MVQTNNVIDKQLPFPLSLFRVFIGKYYRSANNEHGQIPPDGVGWSRGGGGVTLMYQLYAAVRGMGFRAVNSGIGYRNRTVLV